MELRPRFTSFRENIFNCIIAYMEENEYCKVAGTTETIAYVNAFLLNRK